MGYMELKKFNDEEEKALWDRYIETKSIDIRNLFVEHYSFLVYIIVNKLRGVYEKYGDFDDAVSEGIIALMDVIDRFDPSKGVKFETFASYRIRGAVIDFARSQDWTPQRVKQNYKELRKAETELNGILGRQPEDIEIAKYMNISLDEYSEILSNKYNTSLVSFEELLGEAKLKNNSNSAESEVEAKELNTKLLESINSLNDNERTIITLYYMENLKFIEIAEVLDLGKSRVSQLHTQALNKLEKVLREYIEG